MNRVEAGINTTQVFSNGIEITTKPLIDIKVGKNPDIVDLSEAGHVVLNPWNIKYVISNANNGATGVINRDAVQLAAHEHGNGHDQALARVWGVDYDKMASIAASELSELKGKQFYFAGYLNLNKGREISRGEALNVLDSYEDRNSVEVTIKVGEQEVTVLQEGDGEHVSVDFDLIAKEHDLELAEDSEETQGKSGGTLIEFPKKPILDEAVEMPEISIDRAA